MNILMMTNTYTPHVGGVARSIERFVTAFRAHGHRVLVIAPEFEDMPEHEEDVVRVPAIQHFNSSDFSVALPIPLFLQSEIDAFRPEIVHSHHPFLLGGAAIRIAGARSLPIVFTHHTLYERYTHYVPGDSPAMRRFVIDLSTSYANLCDQVVAPSETIAELIRARGVVSPVDVVPTGLDIDAFANGDGAAFRDRLGIPRDANVIGHVGRLAPEKNMAFLARAVARYARADPAAHVLVVGSGPSESVIEQAFDQPGNRTRLHMAGQQVGRSLADAYAAMDVFAFASHSETQGMVLTEAMAAGVPVVAIDAPGVREVVVDGLNGSLLFSEDDGAFAAALDGIARMPAGLRKRLQSEASSTAEAFAIDRCADKSLNLYRRCIERDDAKAPDDDTPWHRVLGSISAEWELIKNVAEATEAALGLEDERPPEPP